MRRLPALTLAPLIAGLFIGPAMATPSRTSGTITINNPAPHYGETVTMTYHVERRYRQMVGAVLCWQTPGQYNFIGEWSLNPHANDGTYSATISEPYPPNLPPFDKTQPAQCIAYVFREPQSAQATGMVLTNVLSMEVMP